ncbi:hypothetical protein AB0H76_03460 [Nocardia sp. NPDC050712]|uniref:hypothetical protein n=1 Tax=Nocardia sp. NPDC050712 TaxID=3155518 RepID=UPI0033EEF709
METLNGHDIAPVGGGAIVNSVPTSALTLITPPPSTAPPESAAPPQLTLEQAKAEAAVRGYYLPGSVVEYQGRQFKVAGVSIGYPGGVATVNGHDLIPVGGGAVVNLVPYSALTLLTPPAPRAQQPAPPPRPTQPAPQPTPQPAPAPPASGSTVDLATNVVVTSSSSTIGKVRATVRNPNGAASGPATMTIVVHPVQGFSYKAGAGGDCTSSFIPNTSDSQFVCTVPAIAAGGQYTRDIEVENLSHQGPRYVQVSVTTLMTGDPNSANNRAGVTLTLTS